MYSLKRLRADLRRDIEVYLGFSAEYHQTTISLRRRLSALFMPSIQACALYRTARWFSDAGWPRTAMAVTRLNLQVTRVSISPRSRIGGGLYIPHPATSIVFQGHAGRDLSLFAGAAVLAGPLCPLHAHYDASMPVLGDNVALGSKALVYGPVNIGSNVRIGFNACVQRDLPSGSLVFAARVRNRVKPRSAPEGAASDPRTEY